MGLENDRVVIELFMNRGSWAILSTESNLPNISCIEDAGRSWEITMPSGMSTRIDELRKNAVLLTLFTKPDGKWIMTTTPLLFDNNFPLTFFGEALEEFPHPLIKRTINFWERKDAQLSVTKIAW